ncbi:MAG: LacI family DNA-binding transcriptional regulator, partial [Algisphaera sp.]
MATLRQVAQLANVSPATASRVLGRSPNALRVSEKTTQRVRDAAEQLGYRVNYHMQAVATGRTLTTGFITSTKVHHHLSFGAGDLYFEALRRGVDYSLQEEGSTLLSVRPNPQFSALAQAVHYIAEKRLDALIVPSYDGIVDHLNQTPEDLPVVVVNHAEEINRTQVSFNSEKAIQQIVQHLKALEHRTVLWFGPIATDKNSTPAQRQQCFVESTREAGLKSILCLA